MARAFAVAAAASLAVVLAAPSAHGARAPRKAAALKLASLAPLAVTGRSFGARETVLVTYLAADGATKLVSVRATRSGRFRAVFKLRVGRCDSFTVRAFGTAGSRAVLQVARSCDDDRGPPKRPPKKPKTPRDG